MLPENRDLSALDDAIDDAGVDGYLVNADGTDANQRYLSGFTAPDPFHTCYMEGDVHLLVSGLEFARARSESSAATVSRASDYDYRDLLEEHGPEQARTELVLAWLDDRGVSDVLVPNRFPLGHADRLREAGATVRPDGDDAVERVRAVKTTTERDHVRSAQRANEAAFRAARDLLAAATVEDGRLHHDGEVLTSERVKVAIEVRLLREGCGLEDTIVACGADAADPHERGSGPLHADEPIIVDIFPRSKVTGYHADTTRTYVVGEPTETVREWFDLTDEARQAALDHLEPGVTGETIHDAVCAVYEDAGLPTVRSDPTTETGFTHTTGHGVGLAIHERPRVASDGGELEVGNVITIEPGLYDPDVGGVRIEDLVVVTEDGYENLTDLPVELVV